MFNHLKDRDMYRKNKLIRLVTVQAAGMPNFFETVNDGLRDGKCSVGGFLGQFYTDFLLNPLLRDGYNCTITNHGDWGEYDPSTGNFSGINGAIQSKRADASLTLMSCPPYYDKGIECSDPILSNLILMSSTYNYTNKGDALDVIDLYLSLDWSYWVSIQLVFLLFTITWSASSRIVSFLDKSTHARIQQSRKSASWIMTCVFLDQDSFPVLGWTSFSILSLLVSFFVFVMIHAFALEVAGTDLVVIKNPVVIADYEDAVTRDDVSGIFFKGMREGELFKSFPQGSIERALYEKSKLVEPSNYLALMQNSWSGMVNQKLVTVFRDYFTFTIARFTRMSAKTDPRLEDIRVLLYVDENQSFTENLIYGSSAPTYWKRLARHAGFRMREFGIVELAQKKGLPSELSGSEMPLDEFASTTLFLGSMPEPVLYLSNLYKLFIICSFILLSASTSLWYERIPSNGNIGKWIVHKLKKSLTG